MHVITFYSFKGGVGRSMALANVAYALAKTGRRVLAVDFDLEAPGLCSYAAFRQAGDQPGVVEFVHRYLQTDEAPPVEEYITECEFGGATLWLMPAGRYREPEYSGMLNAIDWQALYVEREGFLFMEDMKEQWRLFSGAGFDYVLIDSRTGHTDVGGICTRHLPDAVVVMFVPTPQNIDGLEPIVAAIAAEPPSVREVPVKLHFCPSNVPDLDDDEEILARLLDGASSKLNYTRPAAVIQHYRSLDLLLQPIVTQSNAGSRLSRQYEELRRSLVGENLADHEGALFAMDLVLEEFRQARTANDRTAIDAITAKVVQIRTLWPGDGEIAWKRAALANERVRPEEEMEALDVAIAAGIEVSRARLHRAFAQSSLGNHLAALDDVRTILAHDDATTFEIAPALQIARSLDPQITDELVHAGLANDRLGPDGKAMLLMELMTSVEGMREAADIARAILDDAGGDPADHRRVVSALVIALIGLSRFDLALDAFGIAREHVLTKSPMDAVFNYAIAEWGSSGVVPADLFERVIELRMTSKVAGDPNALQCFAVCHSALGRHDLAYADLEASGMKMPPAGRLFSCWRYLEVQADAFMADLQQMKDEASLSRPLVPLMLRGPKADEG